MNLDICISYIPHSARAMKFTTYVEDNPHKDNLIKIYQIFDQYGYHCPEVKKIDRNRGMSFKWENDNSYILATIYYNDMEYIHYIIGNSDFSEKSTGRVDDIEKFLQSED